MAIDIEAGTVLVRAGFLLPTDVAVESAQYSKNWDVVAGPEALLMDRSLRAAGWNFFFIADRMHASNFGSREGTNARKAVDRILSRAHVQRFNCVEISEIAIKRFLGVPYVSVSAHARHIQQGLTLDDSGQRREAGRLTEWARG